MIRPTQAAAPGAVATSPSGAVGTTSGTTVGVTGIETTLFGAAGPTGPVAEEVVRFAQALAAVRAGQVAVPGASPGESPVPAIADTAQPVPVQAQLVEPDRSLFTPPSWLRPRTGLATTGPASPPTTVDETPMPQPRRATATPALAVFGAPPWLKVTTDTPDHAAVVPKVMPATPTRSPQRAAAAATAPAPNPGTVQGPASAAIAAPELRGAMPALPPTPVFPDDHEGPATAAGPTARGGVTRRTANPALPAAAATTGADLPVPPPVIALAIPPAPTGADAGLSLGLPGNSVAPPVPAGRSRTPMQAIVSAHARAVADGAGSGDSGADETTGTTPGAPAPASAQAAPVAMSGSLGLKDLGSPIADLTPGPTSDRASATVPDAGLAKTDPSSGVRPSVDLAGVAALGAAAPDRAAPVEVRSIPVDVAAPHWPKAVAAELVMLGHQKVESATLRLSPEHLGQIEVHIHLDAKVINLTFGAAHSETRSALEHALPQLRDGFAQAGLTLGEATVQQQMRQESQNDTVARKADSGASDEVSTKSEQRQALSLVDEYA